MDPFLEIADFEQLFDGTLSNAQSEQAELLLQVASDRIRELKSDVDEDAAKQVVFEIARDAVLYGHLEKFSSFQNITSRRQEAGTFDEAAKAVDDLLTDRHKRILGIPLRAAPRGHFVKCDY